MEKSEILYYFLYFILNFLCYFLVIFTQSKSFISFPFSFHFFQLFSSCLSLLILSNSRNQPGYIDKDKDIKNEDNKETKNKLNPIDESIPIVTFNLMPNNGCKICKISKLPLRSHHCEKCEKCVKGFDHHCWILAGCVGENNRFQFILFLFFQNISIIFSLYGILIMMNNNQRNEELIYILTFLFSIMCLFEIFFFWILIYHIYLLITNQSTLEIFNEEICSYLSIFTIERKKILAQRGIYIINNTKLRPFDIGIINNIYLYLWKMINDKNEIDWEKIYFDNLKAKKISLSCGDKEIQK